MVISPWAVHAAGSLLVSGGTFSDAGGTLNPGSYIIQMGSSYNLTGSRNIDSTGDTTGTNPSATAGLVQTGGTMTLSASGALIIGDGTVAGESSVALKGTVANAGTIRVNPNSSLTLNGVTMTGAGSIQDYSLGTGSSTSAGIILSAGSLSSSN